MQLTTSCRITKTQNTVLLICMLLVVYSCSRLPEERLFSFYFSATYTIENDTIYFNLKNPLACPIKIKAKSKDPKVEAHLEKGFPFFLGAQTDTLVSYYAKDIDEGSIITFSGQWQGNKDSITPKKISLPFPSGKTYRINQGYNGAFSHNTLTSKYALDFALKIGDTICAVADGYVVGVVEDYKYGGSSRKWRDFANDITIFHPEMNTFSQYVHLDHNGSLVNVGDTIKRGQPIAISGLTGFTSGPHLHFCMFKVTERHDFLPIATEFIEGYNGEDLEKGMLVEK